MLTSLLTLVVLAAAILATLSLYLYLRQESVIFHPSPNDPRLLQEWASSRVEIPSGDTVLEGWWIDNPSASGSAVILYFGGNAEDVLYTAATFRHLKARRALVVNYRGYGTTNGKPSQSALFQDGLAIYDYAVHIAGINPADIVVMGRSLGSSVATMLAVRRTVRAAILVTPFDSLAAVAAHHYRFMPVRLLLRHPFPSINLAKEAEVPVLMIAGGSDWIIPAVHAQRLYEVWAGKKQLHILPEAGHNDIERHPRYETLINGFLRQ